MMFSRTMAAVVLGLLGSGCAAAAASAARTPAEPACSFRAATTCWTVGARFPTRQAAPPLEELRAPPPPILASASDSTSLRP